MYRSDPKLIRACLDGDESAWCDLIDRYGRLVYSVAVRYGFGENDADDVVQCVFTTVFRKLGQLKDQTRLSAWLITMTHRECWRVARRRPDASDLDAEQADPDGAADEDVVRWEQQHLVRMGLEQLGGSCQELLTALFIESDRPDYASIGERLGMKVGSIGPTRARCFRKLEKILADLGLSVGDPGAPVAETAQRG